MGLAKHGLFMDLIILRIITSISIMHSFILKHIGTFGRRVAPHHRLTGAIAGCLSLLYYVLNLMLVALLVRLHSQKEVAVRFMV